MYYEVINLDWSEDRLLKISNNFSQFGKNFRRYSAVGDADPLTSKFVDRERFNYLFDRNISKGELGCFLSHVGCLEKFVKSGDEYFVLLEDDVELDFDAFGFIESIPSIIETHVEDWHCVHLSRTYEKRFTNLKDVSGNVIRRSWEFPITTSALMWSRRGALEFLHDFEKNGIYAPIDDQLRYVMCRLGRGFSCEKPPVKLVSFQSEIDKVDVQVGHSELRNMDALRKNSFRKIVRRAPRYIWSMKNMVKYLFSRALF